MAVKTLAQLRAEAQTIKNETIAGANTATRVGGLLDDMSDSLDSLVGHLWQHYEDSQYTSGSTLTIVGGNRAKITIDGLARKEASPNGYTDIWATGTSRLLPFAIDDFYSIRLVFQGSSSSPTNHFDVELDIGGAIGVIAGNTHIFTKGTGNPQRFTYSTQFFIGSTFLANGCEIYITPDQTASFWDFGLTISRIYTPIV